MNFSLLKNKGKLLVLLLVVAMFLAAMPATRAEAATKTYTISKKTEASKSYQKLQTYNSKTKDCYVFRTVFEKCEKNGGGKVIIKAGTYTITNPVYIPSNTTVIFEDGVVMKKGSSTGTSKLKPSLSMFQLIRPSKAKSKGYYKGYDGEHDITITGQGNATFDLGFYEKGICFVIGHSKNITIEGIQFKNLNSGHFIEIDACKDSVIRNCTFSDVRLKGNPGKEAINVDTPDLLTRGFNNDWSSHDKTPVKNLKITGCTFSNVAGIGTHSISKEKSETGLYDKTMWHDNIEISNCKFINPIQMCLRLLGWSNTKIINNIFQRDENDSHFYRVVLQGHALKNLTMKDNVFDAIDMGSIMGIHDYRIVDGKIVKLPGKPYEPSYSELTQENLDSFKQNKCINGAMGLYVQKGHITGIPATDVGILVEQ